MTRPMPRNPDVIGVAHVITRAVSVIRPIASRDRNGAWVTGSVWAITPIIRSIPWIRAIILFASAYTEHDRKQKKEEEHRPFPYRSRSISGGDAFLLRAPNNLHFHTIIYGLEKALTCMKLGHFCIGPENDLPNLATFEGEGLSTVTRARTRIYWSQNPKCLPALVQTPKAMISAIGKAMINRSTTRRTGVVRTALCSER